MDDTFDQLDQAAVAGAEGTTWPIPDLTSPSPPPPPPTCFPVFEPFADDSNCHDMNSHSNIPIPMAIPLPMYSSLPIPIPPKAEPVDTSMVDAPTPMPVSPSLCSSSSTTSHVPTRPMTTNNSSTFHSSRAFVPVRSSRKRLAAAIDELSTSPTSIAIDHEDSNDSGRPNNTNDHQPYAGLNGSSMHTSQDEEECDVEDEEDELEMEREGTSYCGKRDGKQVRSTSKSSGHGNGHSNGNKGKSAKNENNVSCSKISSHDLTDLSGTTAARSRKMTDEERKIMLHKRRLRNRASAARSREKRSRTLNELTSEVEDLMNKSARLAQQATQAVEEARKLRAKNFMLMKENELLKAELNL